MALSYLCVIICVCVWKYPELFKKKNGVRFYLNISITSAPIQTSHWISSALTDSRMNNNVSLKADAVSFTQGGKRGWLTARGGLNTSSSCIKSSEYGPPWLRTDGPIRNQMLQKDEETGNGEETFKGQSGDSPPHFHCFRFSLYLDFNTNAWQSNSSFPS